MNWTSSGLEVLEVPIDNPYGFIYKLNFSDGTYYYGMKKFHRELKLPALKSGEQRPNSKRTYKNRNGSRVYFDVLEKETDWKTYEGSSDNTKDLDLESKEILAFARTKRELTYLEAKCLFQLEALEDPQCHNANILSSFYRDNLY